MWSLRRLWTILLSPREWNSSSDALSVQGSGLGISLPYRTIEKMMNKFEVVVENRTEVRANISIEQIESYLRRTGWSVCNEGHLWRWWTKELEGGREADTSVPLRADYVDFAHCMTRSIYEISLVEKRQRGDVLLDVARELESDVKHVDEDCRTVRNPDCDACNAIINYVIE